MSSTVQVSDELLPGYVLNERIGSGGYAEVWRARAPGGIDKAVKIVFGYFDEELAVQEMKSLERIKDVRHPFLLSLERFEVVDGRLAIITELADMSLEQRAQQCRAEGLPGIPRDELSRYMADAAEALDYLGTRHGLQHLDIKPANLLISGDHLKVADFGLVKELTNHTQNSLVAGMTPSYSSPEMFDDAPSPHSDQYSLAIVYQEMLVGSLPFPGRTAAQLAKQHTLAQPQLTALPAQDRPIIARALAKSPNDRFESCRDFAKALREATDDIGTGKRSPARAKQACERQPAPTAALEDTKSAASGETCPTPRKRPSTKPPRHTLTRSSISVAERTPPKSTPVDIQPEPIVDVESPEVTSVAAPPQPTFVVAVGGVGIRILSRIRESIAERAGADNESLPLEYLAVDTDRRELQEATSSQLPSPLFADDTVHLPLRLPQEYLDESRESLEWLSRRWLYNIPRSLETRGYRPLGRLALVDQIKKALGPIDKKLANLQKLRSSNRQNEEISTPIRVIVVAGMGGGTGGGMAVDLANAIRTSAQAREMDVELQAILVCTCLGGANSSPLAIANTFSLLTELNHASQFGNRGEFREPEDDSPLESSTPPFDAVFCVPASSRAVGNSGSDGLRAIAKYVSLDLDGTSNGILRTWRTSPTPQESVDAPELRLRSFGWSSLATFRQARIGQFTAQLEAAVRRYWPSEVEEKNWNSLSRLLSVERKRKPKPPVEETQSSPAESTAADGRNDPPIQDPRSLFGSYRTSQFAFQFLSQFGHILEGKDKSHLGNFSQRRLTSLVKLGYLVIAEIGSESSELDNESNDTESEFDRAFGNFISDASDRILARLIAELDALRGDTSHIAELVGRIIAEECQSQVTALASQASELPEALQLTEEDVSSALEYAAPTLLQCGCDRRTAFLHSETDIEFSVVETLKSLRPTCANRSANVEEAIILCETSGISPRSMALGMQRVYPDIADAARRVGSRSDIRWQELI